MVKMVEVFPPDGGKGSLHTIPNARDLVLHAGWGYRPGKVTLPVEQQPYRAPAPAGSNPSKAQEILDAAGLKTGNEAVQQQVEAFVPPADPVKIVEVAQAHAPVVAEEPEGPSADDIEAEAEAVAAEQTIRTRKPRVAKAAGGEEI